MRGKPGTGAAAHAQAHARARRSGLPTFALYGERAGAEKPLLHIESIATRSRLYHWEIEAHVHEGLHQVLWLRSGRGDIVLDASRSSGVGPLLVSIPPGVVHGFRFSPDSEGHVLTFDAQSLAESAGGEFGATADALAAVFSASEPVPVHLEPRQVEHLHAMFTALCTEHDASDGADTPIALYLARALVWRLALLVRRGTAPGARQRQAFYPRWVALLEAHYRDHWSVSRYAARLGLTRDRLNRMLRSETGQPAQALIHERLVREASRRLVHVAVPVSKLAFELGFSDPAYFCRFFKLRTGVSPSEYRERALVR